MEPFGAHDSRFDVSNVVLVVDLLVFKPFGFFGSVVDVVDRLVLLTAVPPSLLLGVLSKSLKLIP